MSDTPETYEAVERWRQGKINVFDELARMEIERNKARRALELIAEDCDAWLANQCDETCCEMIKLVANYARERLSDSQVVDRERVGNLPAKS